MTEKLQAAIRFWELTFFSALSQTASASEAVETADEALAAWRKTLKDLGG